MQPQSDDVLIFHTIPLFPSTTKCHVPFTHKSKHILSPLLWHCYWNIYDWSLSSKTSSSAKRLPWDYCTFCLAGVEATQRIVSCCSVTEGGWGLRGWAPGNVRFHAGPSRRDRCNGRLQGAGSHYICLTSTRWGVIASEKGPRKHELSAHRRFCVCVCICHILSL